MGIKDYIALFFSIIALIIFSALLIATVIALFTSPIWVTGILIKWIAS